MHILLWCFPPTSLTHLQCYVYIMKLLMMEPQWVSKVGSLDIRWYRQRGPRAHATLSWPHVTFGDVTWLQCGCFGGRWHGFYPLVLLGWSTFSTHNSPVLNKENCSLLYFIWWCTHNCESNVPTLMGDTWHMCDLITVNTYFICPPLWTQGPFSPSLAIFPTCHNGRGGWHCNLQGPQKVEFVPITVSNAPFQELFNKKKKPKKYLLGEKLSPKNHTPHFRAVGGSSSATSARLMALP